MKIKEIGISVSRTFNLGDYNSLRVEATVTASVDEDETAKVRLVLLDEVRETLRRTYMEFKPKPKEGDLL